MRNLSRRLCQAAWNDPADSIALEKRMDSPADGCGHAILHFDDVHSQVRSRLNYGKLGE